MVPRATFVTTVVLLFCAVGGFAPAPAQTPVELTVFGAGTLAAPFSQIDEAFQEQNPGVVVQAQFGGSVMMARKIADLHQNADVIAVADYSVIPKYLFGGEGKTTYADWYAGFARNAITFVYTDISKFSEEIYAQNWHEYLTRPDVQIGRSNPDTDPSGYQTLQMLALAERHYDRPAPQKKCSRTRRPLTCATPRPILSLRCSAANRLSGDLSFGRAAASSAIPRSSRRDQSQRSRVRRQLMRRRWPTPRMAMWLASRSSTRSLFRTAPTTPIGLRSTSPFC